LIFRRNWSYSQKLFSNISDLKILNFADVGFINHYSPILLLKWDYISAELWRYNDFQHGDRPPFLIMKVCSLWHWHSTVIIALVREYVFYVFFSKSKKREFYVF